MAKFVLSIVFLFTALSGIVSALPTTEVDAYPNMVVLTRNGADEAFIQSPSMASQIKTDLRSGARSLTPRSVHPVSRNAGSIEARDVLAVLEKRQSTITLGYCSDSGCSNCKFVTSSFATNFCFNAPGTHCIIIEDLNNAKIRYWNNQNCNGNESTFLGCGGSGDINAPGTNSIGFQTGCS
jgi:hypothetical protein